MGTVFLKRACFRLLLYIIFTSTVDLQRVPEQAQNVALFSRINYQPPDRKGREWTEQLTDGDLDTCVQTDTTRNNNFYVEFLEEEIIVGVQLASRALKDDQVGMNATDVWVGTSAEDISEYCVIMRPTGQSFEMYDPCDTVKEISYIKFANPRSGGFLLCEVLAYECLIGYFGRECSKCNCLEDQVCSLTDGRCPSGKCKAGFEGDNCYDKCEDGFFGVNCEDICHCKLNTACDTVEGTCNMGCASGWFGRNCQINVPRFRNGPDRLYSTTNSIVLQWKRWPEPEEEGFSIEYEVLIQEHGLPTHEWEKADVEYQPQDMEVWVQDQGRLKNRPTGTQNPQSMSVKVINLRLNSRYAFKVMTYLVTEGGDYADPDSPRASRFYRTKCRNPASPTITDVKDVKIEGGKVYLEVFWEGIANNQSFCDAVLHYSINVLMPDIQKTNGEVWASAKTNSKVLELEYSRDYHITVRVYNNKNLGSNSDMWIFKNTMIDSPSDSDGAMLRFVVKIIICAGGVAFVGLVIGIICLFCQRRRRAKRQNAAPVVEEEVEILPNGVIGDGANADNPANPDPAPSTSTASNVANPATVANAVSVVPRAAAGTSKPSLSPPDIITNTTPYNSLNRQKPKPINTHFPIPPPRPFFESRPIRVEKLEEYVMERRDNECEELKREYKELPEGLHFPCDYGREPDNKHKNRFINIIAYDHNRVTLDKIEGDDLSDYINASYINGYKKEKYYIATQGCNKWTIQDMWRLTWKENVCKIIMVTNLVEGGKRKCEQYWPEQMNMEKSYGSDMHVIWIDMEQTSDFVIRSFQLRKGTIVRDVKQFHFTAWPDHGVPTRAAPILAFRRKVRSFDESHTGPVLTHCSAGVGRTGTFIAIDYLLEQAAAERMIDLYSLTKEMRRARVNMIQTEEQYVFVYDALLEALQTGDTAIACSEFKASYHKLLEEVEVEEDEEGAGAAGAEAPMGTPLGTPAGTPLGTPLGTPAGTPVGEPAGTPAGTPAGAPAGALAGALAGAEANKEEDKAMGAEGGACGGGDGDAGDIEGGDVVVGDGLKSEQVKLLRPERKTKASSRPSSRPTSQRTSPTTSPTTSQPTSPTTGPTTSQPTSPTTSQPTSNKKKIRKTRLQIQFENLKALLPAIKPEDFKSGRAVINITKSRFPHILPSDRHRPYLNTRIEGTNDYINAVFVDGYKSRNAHIITQMPLRTTVIDMWRLVFEFKVGSIVMLNQMEVIIAIGQYWPDSGACEIGPFIIELLEKNNNHTDVTHLRIKLTHTVKGKVAEVNIFQYLAWPNDRDTPTCKTSLIGLFDVVDRSQHRTGNGPVLIHCLDGAKQSGLYLALSCIWEKMKIDQEVDIFHTVRHLQYHRAEVMQSLEQYKFCFEVVLAYLAEFETYANFR